MESSEAYLTKVIQQAKRLREQERNLLVVSDFHLSEGFYEAEGVWAINEDFFFDGPFARFLQFAEKQRARHGGAPWRLICNGDIFDFRQVGVPRDGKAAPGVEEARAQEDSRVDSDLASLSESERLYGPRTTPLMSSLRVDLVYKGHRGFFQTLAWFVARGNELVFIKGNHDVELHWPETQQSICCLLEQAYHEAWGSIGEQYDLNWDELPEKFDQTAQQRVFFLPWNYYEPGRVYIEHGQQFHSTDSQEYVLWPVLPWNEKELELSLGELFGRYFVTQLETLFPLIDNMKPFSKGLSWVFAKGIPSLLTGGNFWGGLRKLGEQFRHALKGASRIYKKRRKHGEDLSDFNQLRLSELKDYGKGVDLGEKCAERLNALKSQPQLRAGCGRLVIRTLGTSIVGLVLLAVAITLLSLLDLHVLLSIGLVLIGVAAWVNWQLRIKLLRPEEFLEDKAVEIHQVLIECEKPVKYVILGHDHHAHLQRVDDKLSDENHLSKAGHFYVNSGTWTAVIVHDEELVQNARQFSLVRVIGDTAHVMRWNDGGGSWEPIVLR